MAWICGSICFHAQVSPCDDEVSRRNWEANELIEKDRLAELKVIKILLLGGPESGKSTIFKQMRILHMNGFSDAERTNYKYLIYSNVFQAVHQIIMGAKTLNIDYEEETKKSVSKFMDYYSNVPETLNPELVETIAKIYKAPFANKVIQQRYEISLLDSATYFLDDIERISDPLYNPTQEDILKSRAQTTGIIEITFSMRKHVLKMVDVGGQRSERRKWIHCFDNVNSILFVVDIAAYNQFSEESFDNKVNRVKESAALYTHILNIDYLKKAVMILFLNKVDVFEEKIKRFPLNICFPNYSSANTLEVATTFLQSYFVALTDTVENRRLTEGINKRPLYTHFTTATDTNMIEKIFENCFEAVVSAAMLKTGMT